MIEETNAALSTSTAVLVAQDATETEESSDEQATGDDTDADTDADPETETLREEMSSRERLKAHTPVMKDLALEPLAPETASTIGSVDTTVDSRVSTVATTQSTKDA